MSAPVTSNIRTDSPEPQWLGEFLYEPKTFSPAFLSFCEQDAQLKERKRGGEGKLGQTEAAGGLRALSYSFEATDFLDEFCRDPLSATRATPHCTSGRGQRSRHVLIWCHLSTRTACESWTWFMASNVLHTLKANTLKQSDTCVFPLLPASQPACKRRIAARQAVEGARLHAKFFCACSFFQ